MSNGSSDPPGDLWIPSQQATDEALDQIAKGRMPQPAQILRDFATTMIQTITKFDQLYQVGRYLSSLQVICKAPGVYELVLHDKNCEHDPDKLAEEVAAQLAAMSPGEYHKPLRRIELGFDVPRMAEVEIAKQEKSDDGEAT